MSLSNKTYMYFLEILRSLAIQNKSCPIALTFGRQLSSGVADLHLTLQGDRMILTLYHQGLSPHEILRCLIADKMSYRSVNKVPAWWLVIEL